ncbi:MAG: WG repeat-containing protein [Oscillibacter sp.]|nr:WG repeat-containing protein [Oscillibacter sp.]
MKNFLLTFVVMTKMKNYYGLTLSYCILLCACTREPDFKITKEFADAGKQYSFLSPFQDGLAVVQFEEKWGFIDKTGKQIIPCIYDYTSDKFSEGLAAVRIGEKRGFIDKKGKQVIPCIYDYTSDEFSEGLVAVRIGEKRGFIDKTGKQVIPCVYDDASYKFSEGLAVVKVGEKWGFIDKTSKQVIPCIYDYAYNFSGGFAKVTFSGVSMLIRKNGKFFPYHDCTMGRFSEGLANIHLSRKSRNLDIFGRFVGDKYEDKWGFVDKYGTCTFDFDKE